jgi:glutathione S-transferase
MKLYNFELSGNCHKIRMLLSMLGKDFEKIDVDILHRDQFDSDFVVLNPLHKVPVLEDKDVVLRDSAAIMVYLVRTYGKADWYPDNPVQMAEVQQWLSFSVNEVFNGLALVRANVIFKRGMEKAPLEAAARAALDMLEHSLTDHDWLALDRFTIADLACYPYTALSHEGGMDLTNWPAIQAWCRRIEAMPGYVSMEGLPDAT